MEYAGRGLSTWRFSVGDNVYSINYHNSEIVETNFNGNVKITLVADVNNELLNRFLDSIKDQHNITLTRTKHVKGDDDQWYDLKEKYINVSDFKKTEYASRMQIGHIEFTAKCDFKSFSIKKSEIDYEPEAIEYW